MAFVELHKSRHTALTHVPTKPTISIVQTTGKIKATHVYIRIPRSIVQSVWADKLINDARTVRLGLHEGTDGDAGFAMLVHNPTGYTFTTPSYARSDGTPSLASFTCKVELSTFKHHVPNILPQPPCEMEYTIDGPAVLLQLPPWFVPGARPVVRSTMVQVEKAAQGRKPTAMPMSEAEQRRLVQQGRR